MPVPTAEKTWQFDVGNLVPYVSEDNTNKNTLLLWKNVMIGFASNPWQVMASSDGSSAGHDMVDRWIDIGDLVYAGSSSPRSWIVLRQSGINTKFEILIECTPGGGFGSRGIEMFVSFSQGFGAANGGTDGTTTSVPTATDQSTVHDSNQFQTLTGSTNNYIHGMMSSDGESTRIYTCRNNWVHVIFGFDKPKNTIAGWTNPACAWYAVSNQTQVGTYGEFNDSAFVRVRYGGNNYSAYMSTMGDSGQAHGQLLTVANELTGEWELTPAGLYVDDTGFIGRIGDLYDFYYCSTALTPGDTFPDSGDPPEHRWACWGDVVGPWDESGPPQIA